MVAAIGHSAGAASNSVSVDKINPKSRPRFGVLLFAWYRRVAA